MSLFTGAAALGGILGTLGAAKIGSNASENAAGLQANAAQQALNFTEGQKNAQAAAAAPYLALGQRAVANLPNAIRPIPAGGPPAAFSTAPGQIPQGSQTGYQPSQAQGTSFQAMAAQPVTNPVYQAPGSQGFPGQVVLLQAPDGSQKAVPFAQAQAYIAKGAKQVNP